MKTAPIAMILQFIQRWFCDRFAPLLTAYVEGGLDEKQKAKVAAHIKTCAACRQEVEDLTELGNLLRANPPAVPQLKPDLWSRIQAEIVAESAAQPEPERPIAQPIRRQPVPNFQWSSFGVSFATTGTLVAAAVVGVVVLTKPLIRTPLPEPAAKKSATALAVVPAADRGPITLEIRSSLKPNSKPSPAAATPNAKTAVIASASARTSGMRPVPSPRGTAIVIARRRERYGNRSVNVPVTRAPRAVDAPVTKPYFVAQADKKEHQKTLVVEPSDTLTVPAEAPAPAKAETTEEPIMVATATPEPMDEVVAPRKVPAAGFVNDTAKIRAHQILFTYSSGR